MSREFKSFGDLSKARGGKGKPKPAKEDKGWSFEDADGGEDAGFEGVDSSRDRILGRPRAFGPMDHGPACYRDEESEEMELLASFRVRSACSRRRAPAR